MTVQLHPSEPASAPVPIAFQEVSVTELEHAVLQHLTTVWNAFLLLPAERVEYIVAFQSGCQQLQKQIMERGENRSGLPVPIPSLGGVASRPVLSITVEERKRRRDEKHVAAAKARRARQMEENPDAVRAKEREKWRRQQDRKREKVAAEKVQGATQQGRRRQPRTEAKTERPKAPSGLSQSDRVRWRYNNDPDFREHVKARNRAYNQKRHAEGHRAKRNPKTAEQKDRDKERHRHRMATDPAYAERRRAGHREWIKRYRRSLKALSQSTVPGEEVRMLQLRMDPLYAAAHAAVPPNMASHHRADIVSDIIMAVLEGQIALADVPKLARSFITAHHRRTETYSTVSLDAPIGDGKVTMHDFISEGMWGNAQADE